MKTRVCTKCGEEKPETTEYFHRAKNRRDGLYTICKECKEKAVRKWQAENYEKVKERNRRYYAKNPEKVKEMVKRYKAENPEKVRKAVKRWCAENPEKVREAKKRQGKRQIDALAPGYLKQLISNKYDIGFSEIGDELINAKRREITYYRQLKQLK